MEEEKHTISTIPTAIINLQNEKLKISEGFPNPFSSNIKFSISSPDECELLLDLINSLGKKIYSKKKIKINKGGNLVDIDLSGQKPGFYFGFFFKEDKLLATRKILKNE